MQRPGADDGTAWREATTRWPDFDPNTPPRPAVIAITREDGGIIGT